MLRRLLGAVMLGVGSLFQSKTDPQEHWSSSPKLTQVLDAEEAGSGAPPRQRRGRQ